MVGPGDRHVVHRHHRAPQGLALVFAAWLFDRRLLRRG
jgi:hypothetical protein